MMLPKFVVVVMDMGMMSFMLVRMLGARRCLCLVMDMDVALCVVSVLLEVSL